MYLYKDDEIAIRTVNKNDAAILFIWWISEDINRHDPRSLPRNCQDLIEECNSFCKTFENHVLTDEIDEDSYLYFIIENSEGNQIGFVNLFDFDENRTKAELGIIIGDKAYWYKKIGRKSVNAVLNYANTEIGLNIVHIETGEENIPALNLFTRLGFEKCGENFEDNGFKWIVMEKSIS